MSSTVLPLPDAQAGEAGFRTGFALEMHGRQAECDGGSHVAGTKFAGRQEFTGTLTGAFRDFGPYPWRWYLLAELTRKPQGYPHEAVWCDAESLTLLGAGKPTNS